MLLANIGLAGVAMAEQEATHYVALGDSYASGVGTDDYFPDSGECLRGPQAYPSLWAAANEPDEFTFAACAGATTSDVAEQLSELDDSVTLVTLSVGGNDVNFASTVTSCLLGTDEACAREVAEGERQVREELPEKLDEVYAGITAAAPEAEVLILGYPRINEPGECPIPGYTEEKRERLNTGADTLTEVIAERAATAGFDYLDVRDAFAGHGVCGDVEWINGPRAVINESFHPNGSGHEQGYLPVLTAATD